MPAVRVDAWRNVLDGMASGPHEQIADRNVAYARRSAIST
jgi:hypothetical protein